MKVELLTDKTVQATAKLYIEVFSKEPWHDVYESFEEVEKFIRSFLSSEAYLNYIAIKDNQVIGLCLGMTKPWIKGMEYYISEFCVKTDLQGLGIGSKFLTEIEEKITELGMNSLILNTEKGYDSEKFYLKNGFKQISGLIVLGK